jgi:hypothetical protein
MRVFIYLFIVISISILIFFIHKSYLHKKEYYKFYDSIYSKYIQKDHILKDDFRNIFCFWNDEKLNPLINECVKNIQNKMKDWKVILLNDKTIYNLIPINKFPPKYSELSIQSKTDWIRLYLIYNYGGLWLDISIIINDDSEINMNYIQMIKNNKVCLFEIKDRHFMIDNIKIPYIESWFIMSKPYNSFIKDWLNEFEYAIDIGYKNYNKYVKEHNYKFSNTESCSYNNTYHIIYKCVQVVLQNNKNYLNDLFLNDAKKSMYYEHFKNLFFGINIKKFDYNVKLINKDRKYIENNLKTFISLNFPIKLKFLNLILYSENIPEYIEMKEILSEYLKLKNIRHYFYCYKEDIKKDYEIIDNVVYFNGIDSHHPGCLDKTLKVFSLFENEDYDFIIRTNISTVINFEILEKEIFDNNILYGTSYNLKLNWLDPEFGIVNKKYFNTLYPSGTCIILSKNLIKLILKNQELIKSYNVIDDLSFGIFLKNYKLKTVNYKKNSKKYDKNISVYRNKNLNRKLDIENMNNIINNLKY